MSNETEHLEREAATRRSNLESTIEELRSRMSVGQIVDELSSYVREGQGNAAVQNLGRQVRDNPLALGLVGAGIAWLFLGDGVRDTGRRVGARAEGWRQGDPYEDEFIDRMGRASHPNTRPMPGPSPEGAEARLYGAPGSATSARPVGTASSTSHGSGSSMGSSAASMAGTLKEKVSDAAHAASSTLSSATSRMGDAASSLGDTAGHYGESARRGASSMHSSTMHGMHSMGHQASWIGDRTRRTFLDTLQNEPLVLGAVALAVGAAIGAALPSTRIEDEYLGETRDDLRDRAYEAGAGAMESARNAAGEAMRAASEEADAQGLSPSGERGTTLAEKVSAVAEAAGRTAKDEARKEGLA